MTKKNNAITYKRKLERNWFEQRSSNIYGNKIRAEGAKLPKSHSFLSKEPLSKGTADMNELYCWIFNLNLYSLNLWYVLTFSKSVLLLAMPLPDIYYKTEDHINQNCFF